MGVFDAQVHVGRESVAYGTLATPTRSFEAKTDPAKSKRQQLQSFGMRAGIQGVRTDRRRNINMGAEGSLEVPALNNGLGMLLRATVGDAAIAQVGATIAWKQTFNSTVNAPNESLTVQVGRPPVDPPTAPFPFTYTGGKVTGLELEQSVGDGEDGFLKLKFNMDYQAVTTATALAAAVYPVADFVYGWPDLQVTLNGVPMTTDDAPMEIKFQSDAKLATDRYRLRRNVKKLKPVRKEVTEYTGSMTGDYVDNTIYTMVEAGAVVPLIWEWEGPTIVGANKNFFRLTMPAVQLIEGDPEVATDDLPKQPVEFVVLDNGVNPSWTIEYQSTDVAF